MESSDPVPRIPVYHGTYYIGGALPAKVGVDLQFSDCCLFCERVMESTTLLECNHDVVHEATLRLPRCAIAYFVHVPKVGGSTVRAWMRHLQMLGWFTTLSSWLNPVACGAFTDDETPRCRHIQSQHSHTLAAFSTAVATRSITAGWLPPGWTMGRNASWRVLLETHNDGNFDRNLRILTTLRPAARALGCAALALLVVREPAAASASYYRYLATKFPWVLRRVWEGRGPPGAYPSFLEWTAHRGSWQSQYLTAGLPRVARSVCATPPSLTAASSIGVRLDASTSEIASAHSACIALGAVQMARFNLVGTTETLDETLFALCWRLGLPRCPHVDRANVASAQSLNAFRAWTARAADALSTNGTDGTNLTYAAQRQMMARGNAQAAATVRVAAAADIALHQAASRQLERTLTEINSADGNFGVARQRWLAAQRAYRRAGSTSPTRSMTAQRERTREAYEWTQKEARCAPLGLSARETTSVMVAPCASHPDDTPLATASAIAVGYRRDKAGVTLLVPRKRCALALTIGRQQATIPHEQPQGGGHGRDRI